MLNNRCNLFLMLLLLAVSTMFSATALAHGLISEEAGEKQVRVCYDDDSPVRHGFVTVYDASGREIAKGETDSEGLFDYSKFDNAEKISIADAHGHSHEHFPNAGSPKKPTATGHKTELIIVVFFLLIAAAVLYNGRKKKEKAS